MNKILLRFQDPATRQTGEITSYNDEEFMRTAMRAMHTGLLKAGWTATVVLVKDAEEPL